MVGFDKTLVVCNKSLLDHLETFYSTLHSCRDTCFGNMMTSSSGTMFRVTGPLWGDSPVTGESPLQRPFTLSFDVFFNLRLNKRLSNAGDFRRHRAHHDATVMVWAVLARVQYHPYELARCHAWKCHGSLPCRGISSYGTDYMIYAMFSNKI